MPIIFKNDLHNYRQKKLTRENYHFGSALYLPKSYEGDSIGDIFKFISNNKDLINNISQTTSGIIDAGSKLSNLTLDTISKIKDIKKKQIENDRLEKEAIELTLKAQPEKAGKGFHIIE